MIRTIAISTLLALAACATDTGPAPPVNKTLNVEAGPNVNQYNEASNPVVVRIYQLSSRTEFEAATFWEVFEDNSPALAGVVLDRRSLSPLFPGETRLVAFDLAPDVFFLGAFAEFADFDTQNFRAAVPIDEARLDSGVTISVTASGVSIKFRNPADEAKEAEKGGVKPSWFESIFQTLGGLVGLGG